MNPSTLRTSFEFQGKLLASDWISIAVDDEVKVIDKITFLTPSPVFEAPYSELVPSFSICQRAPRGEGTRNP